MPVADTLVDTDASVTDASPTTHVDPQSAAAFGFVPQQSRAERVLGQPVPGVPARPRGLRGVERDRGRSLRGVVDGVLLPELVVTGGLGRSGRLSHRQPTAPSICSSMSRFSSRAYSMGSSRAIGSMKPRTIMAMASSSGMPRLIR